MATTLTSLLHYMTQSTTATMVENGGRLKKQQTKKQQQALYGVRAWCSITAV